MRYSVHCPSAPYENSSFINLEDCWGLCLDLSEELLSVIDDFLADEDEV